MPNAGIDAAGIATRHAAAARIVRDAGTLAAALFADRDALAVETKGAQDWVSRADREVERRIRGALAEAFPDDAVLGEEEAGTAGTSGFTWVVDPIDGTTNFLAGTADWCVVLAGVAAGRTVVAHVFAPVLDEAFAARRGHGATLDGQAVRVSAVDSLASGTLGIGHSTRVPAETTLALLGGLLAEGGLFVRSGSGALDLAKVAAGRLIGFCEPHMNAWDCLASLLLVEEAGGRVQPFDMDVMLERGGRVVASAPGVAARLERLADASYGAVRGGS